MNKPNTKKIYTAIIALMLAVLMLLSACNGSSPSGGESSTPPTTSGGEATQNPDANNTAKPNTDAPKANSGDAKGYWSDFTSEPKLIDGTYEIYTAEELAWVSANVGNKGHFEENTIKLMSDIDLGKHLWIPIGFDTEAYEPRDYPAFDPGDWNETYSFHGAFDGNEYTIKNLTVEAVYGGLFGGIYGAEVRNVTLETVSITNSNCSGGLAGFSVESEVTNCMITKECTIRLISEYNEEAFGGMIGAIYAGRMENCSVESVIIEGNESLRKAGDYSLLSNVGGLIGIMNEKAKVRNCAINGDVALIRVSEHAGGLVGENNDSYIEDCNIDGNVTIVGDGGATTGCIGGLAGSIEEEAVLSNCHVAGTVTINNETRKTSTTDIFAGGIVGDNYEAFLQNCSIGSDVIITTPGKYVGGINGRSVTGHVINCTILGNVSLNVNTGYKSISETIGYASEKTRVSDNEVKGELTITDTAFSE